MLGKREAESTKTNMLGVMHVASWKVGGMLK
jgi:hypothetical protein